jgi:hypothetical protein
VSDETCCSNHVGRHAISDEQNDVLRAPLGRQVTNDPVCNCLFGSIVAQDSLIFSRFVEGDPSVGFGSDVDDGGFVGVLSE